MRPPSLLLAGTALVAALVTALAAAPAGAQPSRPTPNVPTPVPGAAPVVTERVTVHGASLEGNLEGDSPDRDVIVYLPPSYARSGTRRYPVLYALHGYSISNE